MRIVEKDDSSTVSDTRLVWCGLELCEAREGSGTTVTRRYFAQGMEDAGIAYFYTRDHLGTVRELLDGGGVVRSRYDYDPWGRRTRVAGDKDAQFGFTGHYEHSPSGTLLAPFRAYDTNGGRWISEDPIGYQGGLNLYAHVGNVPTSGIDPLGWCDWSLAWQISASTKFLKGELEGIANVTIAPIINTIQHPIETVQSLTEALAHPVETIESITDSFIDTITAAAHGDPRAIGEILGTLATVYVAENVRIRRYQNTGGGGINLYNTPTANSRIALDFHSFEGSNGAQLHLDVTIKKPTAPFSPGASGPNSNLINIKHWTP